MTDTPRNPILDQIREATTDLATRLALGATPDDHLTLHRIAEHAAQRLAATLQSDDHHTQAQTVIDLGTVIHGSHNVPASWWRTPVGRICAASLAGAAPTDEAVSQSTAAEILGVTQQAVHKMVASGRLDRHPDGGVLLHSVYWRLAQTPPPNG